MMNDKYKSIEINKSSKMLGTRPQGILETQMEIAETGNLTMYYNIQSVFCANCGMYYAKITKMIKFYNNSN